MELRHLKYFIAAAEEQNITQAARRLHVSQPPLSRQIRDLEAELGVELFERTAKSIRLTEAGRLFLGEARAVLERADEAARAVKAIGSGLSGELRIGYAPSLSVDILPGALRKFQENSPGVRVRLRDLSTGEMLAALRENTIDLALMIHQPAQILRGLETRELRRYGVSVAMSPSHPLATGETCRLADIQRERLIGYSRDEYPEYETFLKSLPWPDRKAPPLAEEHDSVTSLIAAVEAGRGVALAPDSLACLAGPRLRLLRLQPQPPPFAVIAAWRGAPRKVRRFLAGM